MSVGPARRWYRVAWCLFWVLSLAPSFSHAAAPCPEKEFLKNPNAVVDFRDWEGLYASFCKFGGCDNGGEVSESYSDRIPKLLVERWPELERLDGRCRKHPRFRRFVLQHINASGDAEALERLAAVSATCPAKARTLCEDIHRQAAQAVAEINEVTDSAARVR